MKIVKRKSMKIEGLQQWCKRVKIFAISLHFYIMLENLLPVYSITIYYAILWILWISMMVCTSIFNHYIHVYAILWISMMVCDIGLNLKCHWVYSLFILSRFFHHDSVALGFCDAVELFLFPYNWIHLLKAFNRPYDKFLGLSINAIHTLLHICIFATSQHVEILLLPYQYAVVF